MSGRSGAGQAGEGPGIASSPGVSVVIPTFERETRLAFALEALAAQTLQAERFEVIVVRAEGATGDRVAEPPAALGVQSLVSPVAGAAAQRNLGWQRARGSVIAFLDDDCRPEPGWLERLTAAAAAAADGAGNFVQGRTVPDPDERHLLHGLARTMVVQGPSPWYPSCNIAYPRALLERLGGFDESFPGAFAEDTDLAMRALDAGAQARFVGEACVRHAVHTRSLPEAVGQARRRSAVARVVKRHPRARRGLYARIFFTWRHAYTWLLLVGATLAPRRPLIGLAVTLPYLVRNADRNYLTPRGVAIQAARLPARLCVDIAEVVVVLRAALKERVLVL